MQVNKPLIGIIPDYKNGCKEEYSAKPYYALRCNYADMINQSGAIALILSYDYNLIDDYLKMLDGILIVGGYFDVDPIKYYGEKEIHKTVKLNEVRGDFEYQFCQKILQTKIPFFGICNGMQVLNAVNKGKIIQHISDEKNYLDHEQGNNPDFDDYCKCYHDVEIKPDTKLHQIIGEKKIRTNSSHHQAIKEAGAGLKVCAKADDGIIEAIEKTDHPFCLGVQWHPEYNVTKADKKIFTAFAKAAAEYKNLKRQH